MNLPMRQDKKRNQALDAFASVAKTWSEWRLGERAAKSVSSGTKKASRAAAKARKRAGKSDSSRLRNVVKSTPVRIAGAAALVGGVGAAVAKKLKGGGTAEPLYSPAADDSKDVPPAPPTAVKVGDLDGTGSAVASSEAAITAAGQRAGDVPAEGASEKAVADATPPPPSGTEPSVPDTDVDQAVDTTGDDEVEDAMDVYSDSEDDAAAGAQSGADDAPTIPADSDKS